MKYALILRWNDDQVYGRVISRHYSLKNAVTAYDQLQPKDGHVPAAIVELSHHVGKGEIIHTEIAHDTRTGLDFYKRNTPRCGKPIPMAEIAYIMDT
jgi:hypothetical protein